MRYLAAREADRALVPLQAASCTYRIKDFTTSSVPAKGKETRETEPIVIDQK